MHHSNVNHIVEQHYLAPCGMRLAYQRYGETDAPRGIVLALHGWLDNAASFERLAPLLVECGYCVLALDLPGHGLSDARHDQAGYNLYDDLRQLVPFVEDLDRGAVYLLGHSRGAMIALLLAACFPELVQKVVFLDGMLPPPVAGKDAPAQLAKHVRDFTRARRKPLGYDSFEQALNLRMKATSMSRETSEGITRRALYQGDDGRWYWRTDPRLRGASAIRLNQELNDGFSMALTMPALLILAEDGFANYAEFIETVKTYPHIERITLAGGHHFHLEQTAEQIAQHIERFLA